MVNLKSVKTQVGLFLSGFAVTFAFTERNAAFLWILGMAVICAAGAESLILFLKTKKLTLTESSIISGLIIGFVLSGDQPFWMIALAAFAGIVSKHLIKIKGRHVFNPAGFGVFLAIILLGAQTQWKGTFVWYILVPAGLYFVNRIKKIEVIIGYFLASLVLFGTQAFLHRVPLWKIFGYFSYFYIFIMAIEPKTTPITRPGKFLFGLGTAALIFILTQAGVRFDVELCSLLLMNLAVPWLNKRPALNLKGGYT